MPKSTQLQLHPRWRKTKLLFYTWWAIQALIPVLLLLASLVSAAISHTKTSKTTPPNPTHPTDPNSKDTLLSILMGILLPLADLSLFYYLVVKLRAVVAAKSGVVSASSGRAFKWGWSLRSALATEAFWMSDVKGAGMLLVAATVWIPSWGLSTVSMVVPLMFVGRGTVASLGVIGLVVGGASCLGHLVYVWGRSVRVLVVGLFWKARGRGNGVEEEDGEGGERLLPLVGEERV
ncbi:hypothetical protein QBC34DRAFT_386274 [Podospora aff. communis PSN243]|uniref:Uncharacterized protein n=1 Tax=Podospora aff. communis PSN243 TaxID=3040156 RepID=A0AAV9G5L0_9PEZI|nr:hypothetical protein QBC34DRAFT_386274 [Podospora aff. communis PSN243]